MLVNCTCFPEPSIGHTKSLGGQRKKSKGSLKSVSKSKKGGKPVTKTSESPTGIQVKKSRTGILANTQVLSVLR